MSLISAHTIVNFNICDDRDVGAHQRLDFSVSIADIVSVTFRVTRFNAQQLQSGPDYDGHLRH